MKKILLSVMIAFFGFSGGLTYANWTDDILAGIEDTGEFMRDTEEYFLKMDYHLRPYEEDDLNFNQWKELHGHPTSGIGPLPTGEFKLPKAEAFGSLGANTDMRKFILNVLNWVLSFLGIVAIAVIIFAGYLYIVGGEENNEKSKKMILYASVGILVILSSYALVNTLITKTLEGGDNYKGIQSYVSVDDVVKDIHFEAACSAESDQTGCVDGETIYGLGSLGILVTEYYDVDFWIYGTAITVTPEGDDGLRSVQWNFGDRNLYDGAIASLSVEGETPTTVYHSGQVSGISFTDYGWHDVSVMGEIVNADNPEIVNTFVGKTRVLVGDIGDPKIKISPSGNPDVGEEIEFDASASKALVGGIDDYDWACAPANSLNCGVFDTAKMANEEKQKKTFFVSFPEEGIVDISLRLKIRYTSGTEGVKETREDFAAIETLSVQGEASRYDAINFTYPKTIVEEQEVQLVAEGAPTDGMYDWEITSTYNSTDDAWDFTSPDATFSGNIYPYTFTFSENQDLNMFGVKLKAYVDTDRTKQIGGDVIKNIPVATLDMPQAVAEIDADGGAEDFEVIIPDSTKKVYRAYTDGSVIPKLRSASTDEFKGENVINTWKVNGKIVKEEYLGQIFDALGSYAVSLTTVSKADPTKKSMISFTIKVENNLPTGFDMNNPPTVSATGVSFTTTVGKDPDGSIAQYRLVVSQYGKVLETQVISGDMIMPDATTVTMIMDLASHLDPGTHDILAKWELKDSDGGVSSKFYEEEIELLESENHPPTVELFVTPSTEGAIGALFQFFTKAEDEDGDKLIYTWNIEPEGYSITGRDNISHTFDESGTHTVTVTVFDGQENCEEPASLDIKIADDPNEAPTVSIVAVPETGIATKTSFQLTALGEDADGDTLSYTWVFPDGTIRTGSKVSYVFAEAGTHTINITVFDGKLTGTGSINITVTEEEEEPNVAPTVSIVVLPGITGTTKTTFQFIAQGEDENEDTLTYSWLFPDGTTRTGRTVSYRFPEAGSKRIRVTAFDGEAQANATVVVTVHES